MTELKNAMDKNRRLAILHLLNEMSGEFMLNTSQIKVGLRMVGIAVSESILLNDVTILANHSIVTKEQSFIDDVYIIKLTKYGDEIRRGIQTNNVVARPSPKD